MEAREAELAAAESRLSQAERELAEGEQWLTTAEAVAERVQQLLDDAARESQSATAELAAAQWRELTSNRESPLDSAQVRAFYRHRLQQELNAAAAIRASAQESLLSVRAHEAALARCFRLVSAGGPFGPPVQCP